MEVWLPGALGGELGESGVAQHHLASLQFCLVSRYHRALSYPSSSIIPLPPLPAVASLPGCSSGWSTKRVPPRREAWGGLTKQVQEAVSHSDCWGQTCPWSLTCGLAIVKSTLLPCHLERPLHPTPHSGEGCGSLLTKEFPLWMGDKRQPQGVPLLNWKASDLSFLGGD